MKNFYKKDEKLLKIENLKINSEKIKKVAFQEKIINKDVLYYDNLFGVFYRYKDDNPTFTREEAYDQLSTYIDTIEDIETLKEIEILFIDTANKFPMKTTKRERKKLKKDKKEIKKLSKKKKVTNE